MSKNEFLTEEASEALRLASKAAGGSVVTSGHIILGLVLSPKTLTARALRALGIDDRRVLASLPLVHEKGDDNSFSEEVKSALGYATSRRALEGDRVSEEDLVYSLCSIQCSIVNHLGLDKRSFHKMVELLESSFTVVTTTDLQRESSNQLSEDDLDGIRIVRDEVATMIDCLLQGEICNLDRSDRILAQAFEDTVRSGEKLVGRLQKMVGFPAQIQDHPQGRIVEVTMIASIRELTRGLISKDGIACPPDCYELVEKFNAASLLLHDRLAFHSEPKT